MRPPKKLMRSFPSLSSWDSIYLTGWTPGLWWNAWRLIARDVYYLYVFIWFCYWFIRRSLSPRLFTYPSWFIWIPSIVTYHTESSSAQVLKWFLRDMLWAAIKSSGEYTSKFFLLLLPWVERCFFLHDCRFIGETEALNGRPHIWAEIDKKIEIARENDRKVP